MYLLMYLCVCVCMHTHAYVHREQGVGSLHHVASSMQTNVDRSGVPLRRKPSHRPSVVLKACLDSES